MIGGEGVGGQMFFLGGEAGLMKVSIFQNQTLRVYLITFILKGYCQVQGERLSLISGCRVYFGSQFYGDFLDKYKISNNLFALFDQSTGRVQCFNQGYRPYPTEDYCMESAIRNAVGTVTVYKSSITLENCYEFIRVLSENATEIGKVYSKIIEVESGNNFRLCFEMELRDFTYGVNCPDKIRDYKIDTREFCFHRRMNGKLGPKRYYHSPTIAQFESLLATRHFSVTILDYDLD